MGDLVAREFYEDLVNIAKSQKLTDRANSMEWGINVENRRPGIRARRGDGTFGEIVPGQRAVTLDGYVVPRGPVATVEIGVEVKILAKAMIKQIDRVISDLQKQVSHFRRGAGNPICVAIVGINHADYTVGYEGDRAYRTDGGKNKHPVQEAAAAESRLITSAAPFFNEFIVLRYKATNESPYPFQWVDFEATAQDYGAALVRVSREYDRRF